MAEIFQSPTHPFLKPVNHGSCARAHIVLPQNVKGQQGLRQFRLGQTQNLHDLEQAFRLQTRRYLERKLAAEPLAIRAAIKQNVLRMLSPMRISRVCNSHLGRSFEASFFYLMHLCENRLLKRAQKQRFRSEETRFGKAIIRSFSISPENDIVASLDAAKLLKKLRKKDPLGHQVVIQQMYQGLTLAQIAAEQGLSVMKVRTRLEKSLTFMKDACAPISQVTEQRNEEWH